LARVRGRARRVRADDARGDGARRRRCPSGRDGGDRRRARRLPRRRHRLWPVGAAGGYPPARGRHPVHDHREELERRGHLVREHLSRLPGRRGQPFLLLLVRTGRSLDRVLRPAAGTAALLQRRDGPTRHRTECALADGGRRSGVGRCGRRLAGHRAPRRLGRQRGRGPDRTRRHLRRRPVEPPESFPTSLAATPSPVRRSTRHSGTTRSTSPARAWR
jgi:hypothetical protein